MISSFRKWVGLILHKAYQNWGIAPEAPGAHSSTPSADATQVIKLTAHSLAALERQFPKPMLGNDPNDALYAGQLIGIQRVLDVLRTGWVV